MGEADCRDAQKACVLKNYLICHVIKRRGKSMIVLDSKKLLQFSLFMCILIVINL